MTEAFPIDVIVLEDAAAVAARAARRFIDMLRKKPAATLGLATGETARPVYADLIDAIRRGDISLTQATTFNLDEYVGLPPDHPGSFHRFMREALFDHVDDPPRRIHIPDGTAGDLEAEAIRYEEAIRAAGGVDLQLLGIGANGHIAFNEPGSPFSSRTRVVSLTQSTRAANSGSFPDGEFTPERALTMGVATILDARAIVLVATGEAKADALARAIDGPLDVACPASALRLHKAATILCDRDAAQHIKSKAVKCATS